MLVTFMAPCGTGCHHGLVLKSKRIITRRPQRAPAPVRQADVEALRSAVSVSRVGLWPPLRR
jgi:hypothetical protein